jgi:hypothetical protein
MKHRHLDTAEWSLAAIDSALERGDLADWREMFAAAEEDREIALRLLRVASRPQSGSAGILAKSLVLRLYPGLDAAGHE